MADTLDPKPTSTTPAEPGAAPAAAGNRELTDDELGKVAGGATNIESIKHEAAKSVISNLRG